MSSRLAILIAGFALGLGLAIGLDARSAGAHVDAADPNHHGAYQNGGLICLPNGSCTHGPDPAPEGFDPTKPQQPALIQSADDTKAVCDGNGKNGKRVQVLYVYRTGTPDNYNAFLDTMRYWAHVYDEVYQKSAEKTGGHRYIRYVHEADCTISVRKVRLNSGLEYEDYYSINTELAAKGYNASNRIYLAFFDHQANSAVCGWGNIRIDDQPGSANLNNEGSYPDYATVAAIYKGCWESPMVGAHELGHTFGAVQFSAPNASPWNHCTDEWDVMCYIDVAGVELTYECGDEFSPEDFDTYNNLLDCNNDDYFHTNPPNGSYLKTHWNVASNVFLGESLPTGTMTFDKTSSKYNGVVKVTLSGFTPGSSINVTWPDGTVVAQVKADGSGNAATSFRTPLAPLGDYVVRASNPENEFALATLRVIPRILLNETEGEAGMEIRVYFYGFAPGDQVEVRFWNEAQTSSVKLTTITIASNGRGSKLVTIPTKTTVGDHKVVGKVIGVSRSASTYFEVTGLGQSEEPTSTPSPSPTETATPEPTGTPELTATPEPTTESPTEEPATETPTEEPATETPVPTEEPTQEPPSTETPIPEPTEEPAPTETPEPEPTATDAIEEAAILNRNWLG